MNRQQRERAAAFIKERNEALFSLDKKRIEAYYLKYIGALPSNELVFWASVHKAICQMTNAPKETVCISKKWLRENGFEIPKGEQDDA